MGVGLGIRGWRLVGLGGGDGVGLGIRGWRWVGLVICKVGRSWIWIKLKKLVFSFAEISSAK